MKTISKILSIVLVLSMILGFALIGRAAENTASVTIANYADANNWKDSTKYTSVQINSDIKAEVTGGGNTGKYYTNGENWRLYQSETPTLKITATGKTIVSVKITYTTDKNGVLTQGASKVTSASVFNVNASTVSFGVGNNGDATNGQVRITKIDVVYTESGAPACDHAASKLSWEKDASQHWQVCSCGGYTSAKANHTGNPCTSCGFTTVPVTNGTYVIAIGDKAFSAIAPDKTYGYLPSSTVTISSGAVSGYTNANIFTVTNTADGKFTIQDNLGRYVFMDGDYTSFSYNTTKPSEGAEWVLVQDGNVVLLKNVTKNKNVEYSSNFSTFQATAEAKGDVDLYAATPITQCTHEYTNDYDASCNVCAENRDVTLPAADSTLTLDVAEKVGLAQNHNSYTKNKYYVEGTVTEITSDTYGNMTIKDDAGKTFTIYGSYDANGNKSFKDMANAPKVGDKIKVYGVIGQYRDAAQMKNGRIITVNGISTIVSNENPKDGDPAMLIPMIIVMTMSATGMGLVIKKKSF